MLKQRCVDDDDPSTHILAKPMAGLLTTPHPTPTLPHVLEYNLAIIEKNGCIMSGFGCFSLGHSNPQPRLVLRLSSSHSRSTLQFISSRPSSAKIRARPRANLTRIFANAGMGKRTRDHVAQRSDIVTAEAACSKGSKPTLK